MKIPVQITVFIVASTW